MSAENIVAFSDPILRRAVADALADVAPNAALTSRQFDSGKETALHWALAAEMGWTSAFVEEGAGGLGLDLAHVADICEEMGRNLFCGPFAETAVLVPALARELKGSFPGLLPEVASGAIRVGYAEAAILEGDALEIAPVEHAEGATHLLFVDGDASGGIQILLVESRDAVVERRQPMDPTAPVARVSLTDLRRAERHALPAASAERVLSSMHVAVAADLLGVGEAALARAVEHARTRRQFGQPIGAFQAVKHRLADCRTALSGARLAIAHATRDGADPADARLARILAAEAALASTASALRAFGGSGFSWEVDLHLYLKRARRLNARNGGAAELRARAGDAFIERTLARA